MSYSENLTTSPVADGYVVKVVNIVRKQSRLLLIPQCEWPVDAQSLLSIVVTQSVY